ncbi:SH3 domain-containing protein [Candidatus Leptofilum sp.]|uniref:SH3 domain-containing protein n=1 Tax=Candidatus Leptofilum sp. TaxID=3241576 RepID=UPI003B5C9E83
MKKHILPGLIFLLLVATIWGSASLPVVYGSNTSQTIPTRTPTPPPPTATSSGGGNNGGNNDPTPTTPADDSDPTPTSTLLSVNIAPTPVGGFLPTAVPCGSSPTIQTLDATNVRSGPGLEYEVIGGLVFLEVRNIVGRAATAEWWLIQFNNGDLGWVADAVVTVQGYTDIVPIVEAPPLNGSTPTPGAPWNPTPPPFCTVTPPPTDTPTAVPTESAEATGAVATETMPPTEPPPPTEARPTSTPIVQATAVPLNPTATPTTADPPPPDGSSGNLGLILLGVAVTLGAGIFLFARNRSSQ